MESADRRVAALAALYLLWLATWVVFGDAAYGPASHSWDQAAAAAVTAIAALYASRRTPRPYPWFLAMQGLAFLLLAASWIAYDAHRGLPAGVALAPEGGRTLSDAISDSFYASCVFVMLCAWGYLALARWHDRALSPLTTLVFSALMVGLGSIFAGFYHHEYAHILGTMLGRLDAVTAAFEFAVLVIGLLCMLLKEPPVVVWMLVGTAILLAGDMAYSVPEVPQAADAIWMLGQFLLLSAIVAMQGERVAETGGAASPMSPAAETSARSDLSGILILVSLGAVLLSPLVWFVPQNPAWKAFFSVLFIVALVAILAWITDRFDDTVTYVRDYVRRTHLSRLVSGEWREAPARIRATLYSTALGAFLDEFRASAVRLKENVLFLGPERLYAAPRERARAQGVTCFIVMPFSEEWSADVHRILADACKSVGARAVRGDDLFTPTDILEDIWQSINAADFVIADITGRNPNVLYQLGIAHTLAKPVLILSRSAADIPIDLATRRVILYGQSRNDWRDDLARSMSEALARVVEDYGLADRVRKSASGELQLRGQPANDGSQ